MTDTSLVAAISLGFFGSLHCAAMCGPLAIAGTCRKGVLHGPDTIAYFSGRTAAYTFVGAVFGALGHKIHGFLNDFQQFMLLAVAAFFFVYGLFVIFRRKPTDEPLVQLPKRRGAFAFVASLIPKRGLGLGLATGFLPCGLLMGGWMLAASTKDALQGAILMVAFSLATLPALAAPLFARKAVAAVIARLPRVAWGLAWCLLAVWIGARPFLMAGHAHGGH